MFVMFLRVLMWQIYSLRVRVHFCVYWEWDLFSGNSLELHMQYLTALFAKKTPTHIHIQNTQNVPHWKWAKGIYVQILCLWGKYESTSSSLLA